MKALIAMSGGVDSSVAAYLMHAQGWDCEGITMRLYHSEGDRKSNFPTCCSEQDVADAAEVAFQLDIPYGVLDYTVDFREKIMEKFVRTYERGGTPNPCIDCNRYMKFDRLMNEARVRGFDCVVTGHYARVVYDEDTGRWLLKKALDASKDQSYVLYMLSQKHLAHIRFPLGELNKTEVRQIAEEQSFINARKHDSQDICFVPDRDYAAFIERYTGRSYPSGDFVDVAGQPLGTHRGVTHYTVGQRKGLGLASEKPYYVSAIDPQKNTVTLTHGSGLYHKTVLADEINLISVPRIDGELRVKARIRYRQPEQPATVTQVGDRLLVVFDEPQRAPAIGQALVLYDGDTVVGGGTISEVME